MRPRIKGQGRTVRAVIFKRLSPKMSHLSLSLVLFSVFGRFAKGSATPADWANLSTQVGGRLFPGVPLASPCFSSFNGVSQPVNATACATVQANYVNPCVFLPLSHVAFS